MLRFAFIITIFFFSFINKNHALSRMDTNLVRASIFFVVIADYFLIIDYQHHEIGISFFILAQLSQYLRFTGIKTVLKTIVFLPIIFLIPESVIPDALGPVLEVRFALSYAIVLFATFCGAIYAFKNKKYANPNRYFIVIAMAFFIIADSFVVLYNIGPAEHQAVFLHILWIFTLPAHILLSLSRIKLT